MSGRRRWVAPSRVHPDRAVAIDRGRPRWQRPSLRRRWNAPELATGDDVVEWMPPASSCSRTGRGQRRCRRPASPSRDATARDECGVTPDRCRRCDRGCRGLERRVGVGGGIDERRHAVDQPGVEVAGAHRVVGEQCAQERDVRVDSEQRPYRARASSRRRERRGAVGAACDDLGDHGVVVRAVTRLPVSTAESVRTPGRRRPRQHGAGRREEAPRRASRRTRGPRSRDRSGARRPERCRAARPPRRAAAARRGRGR